MDWKESIQRAVDYIEEHLDDKIDYAQIAQCAYSSSYHFQRVFGIVCGMTLGEYIRRRRLSRAAFDLLAGEKVLDVAIKYGYNSSESFSRAFRSFHGFLPSQVKCGYPAKTFPRLALNFHFEGDFTMKCTVEERSSKTLVGFKKRFGGVPYGQERTEQEKAFYTSTRGKQWLLLGAACDYATEYAIVTNIGDDGYDFYIAYELDAYTREDLFNSAVTGMDLGNAGFEIINLPKRFCAVFPTERTKRPTQEYIDIRKRIVTEWLPTSDYRLADAPEVIEIHWRMGDNNGRSNRFIEITLPIERK